MRWSENSEAVIQSRTKPISTEYGIPDVALNAADLLLNLTKSITGLIRSGGLRRVTRMYARYCRQGKIPKSEISFFRRRPDDPLVLGAIFDFIPNRLQLAKQTNP
jgi:hypothetical protein